MPLVTMKLLEGRTLEQKRAMVKDVTEAIVKNLECPPEVVHIDIIDMKMEHFAKGGVLFSDM